MDKWYSLRYNIPMYGKYVIWKCEIAGNVFDMKSYINLDGTIRYYHPFPITNSEFEELIPRIGFKCWRYIDE